MSVSFPTDSPPFQKLIGAVAQRTDILVRDET